MDYDFIAGLKLSSNNHEVYMTDCRQALPACRINPIGHKISCWECRVQRASAAKQFPNIKQVPFPMPSENWENIWQEIEKKTIEDEQDIKSLWYENMDLGVAALSNAYNYTPDDCIDVKRDFADFKKCIKSILFSYLGSIHLIKSLGIDLVVLWNGRMAEHRAHMRAAEFCETDFWVTEVGADSKKWNIYKSHSPHDLEANQKLINDAWHRSGDSQKHDIATKWFEDRRNGVLKNQPNFVEKQTKKKVSSEIQDGKKLVAIFSSTWREFAALGDEWGLPFGTTQFEATKILVQTLSSLDDSYQIVIRMHPNQINAPLEVKKFLSLRRNKICVIAPEEDTDTYALIDMSHCVISFGSTVGIEACFWEKPSILCGNSFYKHLDVATYCETPQAVLNNILQPVIKKKENSLPYGYYYSTCGELYEIKFKNFYKIKRLFDLLRSVENLLRVPWALVKKVIYK
jgi:hypothetical protein